MIGLDDPLLMDPDDIPLPPAPSLTAEEAVALAAGASALATDAEVDWLAARVLDDHGLPRTDDANPGAEVQQLAARMEWMDERFMLANRWARQHMPIQTAPSLLPVGR